MTVAKTRVYVTKWKKFPRTFRVSLRVTKVKRPYPIAWPMYQPLIKGYEDAVNVWMVENLA